MGTCNYLKKYYGCLYLQDNKDDKDYNDADSNINYYNHRTFYTILIIVVLSNSDIAIILLHG